MTAEKNGADDRAAVVPDPMRAWIFAAKCHLGQLYPGTDLPYLLHLAQTVTALLPAFDERPGLDKNLALCCAVLHDAMEDTCAGFDEIESEFGAPVAEGVQALTKSPLLKGEFKMADSLRRIREQPREVWLVKLSDRTANMHSLPARWSREKILAYAKEARLVVEQLGPASEVLTGRLLARIAVWEQS
ncbi:MAG: HD domain-containing protein [Deltaproteobacteria bacterium]|jgi:(p)ppGpp synthase/HD superfamily hydrolase|nr:HD domain-containing protein [Deltaproteobacteria bacterium]